MENNEVKTAAEDEEISLIDLFSVLLRYRKFIIAFTAIVTVLAGLFLFVLPVANKNFDKKQLEYNYIIRYDDFPAKVKKYATSTSTSTSTSIIDAAAVEEMKNPAVFAAEYKANPFLKDTDKFATELEYNSFIYGLLKTGSKDVSIESSKFSNTISIKLLVPAKKGDTADKFVKSLVSRVDNSLAGYYITKLQDSLKDVNSSIDSYKGNAETSLSYQELVSEGRSLNIYLSTFKGFLTLSDDKFVISVAQGRAMKLIIACFAAFFVAVFVAFLRNAIENIRNDKEASEKISKAWNAGK